MNSLLHLEIETRSENPLEPNVCGSKPVHFMNIFFCRCRLVHKVNRCWTTNIWFKMVFRSCFYCLISVTGSNSCCCIKYPHLFLLDTQYCLISAAWNVTPPFEKMFLVQHFGSNQYDNIVGVLYWKLFKLSSAHILSLCQTSSLS